MILCLINPTSRNLINLLKKIPYPIVILSVLGMAYGQFLFHWALDFASVVHVATMVTIIPIGVVFVARVIEGTKITPPKIISGIGAFLGCIFLLTDRYLEQLSGDGDSILGIYLSIGCALVGAIYLVMVKPYVQVYGPIRMTTYAFVLGFLALYPFIGVIWNIWKNPFNLFDRTHIEYMSIMTLGVWNTFSIHTLVMGIIQNS